MSIVRKWKFNESEDKASLVELFGDTYIEKREEYIGEFIKVANQDTVYTIGSLRWSLIPYEIVIGGGWDNEYAFTSVLTKYKFKCEKEQEDGIILVAVESKEGLIEVNNTSIVNGQALRFTRCYSDEIKQDLLGIIQESEEYLYYVFEECGKFERKTK